MKSIKCVAKIFANGKLTVPEKIRTYLNIQDGDLVQIEVSKIEPPEEDEHGI